MSSLPNAAFASRRTFAGLTPVVADEAPAALHLADNTNLFGTPPAALVAVQRAEAADLLHYPPSSGPALREAIASYLGVRPNEVVIGCGADNIMDCALRAFCEPGDVVAFPDPTFVMARYFALANGLVPQPVPVRADGTTDIESLIAAAAALTYVCAPNNPTGLQPSGAELHSILERASGIAMLDEAYGEYVGATLARDVVAQGRSLLVRTFSKAFGLAGLRVGYGIGAAAVVREVEKARGPFAVSSLGIRAATAAITEDLPWVRTHVQAAIAARQELLQLLRARGFTPFDSAANFLLVPLANAKDTAQRLRQRGIAVRFFTRLTGIGDAIRITVAPRDAMQRVADALAECAR